jgi:hypothetical protein
MVESRQSSRVDFPSLKHAGVGRLRCKAERYASLLWKGPGSPYISSRCQVGDVLIYLNGLV